MSDESCRIISSSQQSFVLSLMMCDVWYLWYVVKDLMLDLAQEEMARQRTTQSSGPSQPSASQSSEPAFPSSERSEEAVAAAASQDQTNFEDQVNETTYMVRLFGLDKSTNLRDLNPTGKCSADEKMTSANG